MSRVSLNDKLLADMKEAMREKEEGKVRLSTIRMVRAALKNAEIEKKRGLSDDEIIDIISREVKKRKDVIPDYEKANRFGDIEQLQEEIKILQSYLPEQLTESELSVIIRDVIEAIGTNDIKDKGKIMKTVMSRLKGKADGKLVSQLVDKMLE